MHKPKKLYTFPKVKNNLPNLPPKDKNNLPKKSPRKQITKIVSSMNKAYDRFNVDIINNKDPQVQLHQSK